MTGASGAMRYRTLGNTGIRVSEIGFGAWGIGGVSGNASSYGPTEDKDSRRALERAFDLGVTFYDTADIYGHDGHSEKLLGEVFATRRDRVVIASKVGFLGHRQEQDFSPARIRAALEAGLRRLRTDRLDLYQLHSPDIDTLTAHPEITETLLRLREEGKIGAYGVSVRRPADAVVAMEQLGHTVFQVNLNLVDHRAVDDGLLDRVAQVGGAVIARTPLCFGFLSGALTADADFHEDDHRRTWSPEQRAIWAAAATHFRSLVDRHPGQTPAQFALRFCLAHPAVASVIPGMLLDRHVDENVAAVSFPPMDAAEWAATRTFYHEADFFISR